MPACDTCRTRKIRCDRESPCGSCKLSKFECTTTARPPRASRKPDLILRRNENFQTRIKPKPISHARSRPGPQKSGLAKMPVAQSTLTPGQSPSSMTELSSVSLVDTDNVEFEGESSLQAQSIVARDLLVQKLGSNSQLRDDPKMIAALSSLRQVVDTGQIEYSHQKRLLAGFGTIRHTIYDLKLPSTEIVLDVLRKAKHRSTFTFSPPMGVLNLERFTELCKTVFFRTEDYPTSTAVIVYGTLDNVLQEFKWSEKDPMIRKQYEESAQLCRMNLETCISNLDLLLPSTMESAQALLVAACYFMEIAQASLCKKMAIHGCMMVQSLGWHRSSSMKNDSEPVRRQKLVVFWLLYVIDKNLSLRLGQASLIQDYDIDVPPPHMNSSAPQASVNRIARWIDSARVMGLIYEQLYSPGALKQSESARLRAVQQLLQQVETIRPNASEKDDISQFVENPESTIESYFYAFSELMFRADEIMYHALLCIVYRAMPTTATVNYDPIAECIKYARAALDGHRRFTTDFLDHNEMWAVYLNWTLLNTPFVPFTTLFCQVLTNRDRADLELLRHFAESMSKSPTSQSALKISRVASVFVSVATTYVESSEQDLDSTHIGLQRPKPPKTQATNDPKQSQPTTMQPTPALGPSNPLLDALGFAGDPSLSMQGPFSTDADLEDWFSGHQHILGLLEDDLSFLDTTAPNP